MTNLARSNASDADEPSAAPQPGNGTNPLVAFLRHYGPIAASDNMYDELIQTEISRHHVSPPIQIPPARLDELIANFDADEPDNIILTGTAGDGKTYHCRRVWEHFGGDLSEWQEGNKVSSITLPGSGKSLRVIKDLSELSTQDKEGLFPELAAAVAGENNDSVFLVAANDGQLIASWRDWAEPQGGRYFSDFKKIEEMLVEERSSNPSLRLKLYNLSRLDASSHFEALIEQLVEHPQWNQCAGCPLLGEEDSTTCPIRLNRELLRGGKEKSVFRRRLGALLKLAGANRMHLPIRDLLLLGVNIILGDQQIGQPLLTCRTAKNRANSMNYAQTNPYANALGANLWEKDRQKYQAFDVMEGFGVGRETDNRFDNLLIYGGYNQPEAYSKLIENDPFYGAPAYKHLLQDYLEGERTSIADFMDALDRQRTRLFFSLPEDQELDPWRLTVYRSAGLLLEFARCTKADEDVTSITELLIKGLNRTFCGMMIDDTGALYLASSGGDGRGRIATILRHELRTGTDRRHPYVRFTLAEDELTPKLLIIDPAGETEVIDSLNLQLTHFEYLVRVANGSLPASFSRQCYEDFLDFKLRLIERLEPLIGTNTDEREVALNAITVDDHGQPNIDDIRIRVGNQ